MDDEAERMKILEMIESRRITAAEGLNLLQALNGGVEVANQQEEVSLLDTSAQPDVAVSPPASAGAPAELPASAERWKRWWFIPLWIGVGITVLGGFLMYAALQSAGGAGFWFLCASAPFAFGVLLLALAWASRSAPWLHLRIQQAPGETPQRIALSLPLPLGLAAWFLQTFGRFIPNLPGEHLEEVIRAVGRSASPDNPIYIQVDEAEGGEKVEIYIG